MLLRETLASVLVSPTAVEAPGRDLSGRGSCGPCSTRGGFAAGLPGGPRGERELLVITFDQEDALEEEGRAIRVIPAWKWLD